MKKLFIFIIASLFATQGYAQLDSAYQNTKEKISSIVKGEEQTCPVYEDTPISKVKRVDWEFEIGMNFMVDPSNGDSQMRSDTWSIEAIHNLSSVFGIFARYDVTKFEKRKYKDSEYSNKWEGYTAVAGIHFYITPVLRIYGGLGTIDIKDNEDNRPDGGYGTVIDRGLKYDIPLDKWGYKVVLSYRIIDADVAGDDVGSNDALADGSHNVLGVSVSIPFGYAE